MTTRENDNVVQLERHSKHSLRFAEFERTVEKFGLSTFVSFVMFKNFEHTNLNELSEEEKDILMEECKPLLDEATAQENSIQ